MWVTLRSGRIDGCRAQLRGASDPPHSVRCGLHKGGFTLEIHSSGGGQKGRLMVRLARQPSGGISGDAFARAAFIPLGFNIGTATLARSAG
jgi:hypothetical protein